MQVLQVQAIDYVLDHVKLEDMVKVVLQRMIVMEHVLQDHIAKFLVILEQRHLSVRYVVLDFTQMLLVQQNVNHVLLVDFH